MGAVASGGPQRSRGAGSFGYCPRISPPRISRKLDLLMVTLNKTEKDYSPSTLYEDYAIDAQHFHWQSQSTTSVKSPTGQRYIAHEEHGYRTLLFVREHKRSRGLAPAYAFLGPVRYVRHYGDKPISMIWRLDHTLPAHLQRVTRRLVTA